MLCARVRYVGRCICVMAGLNSRAEHLGSMAVGVLRCCALRQSRSIYPCNWRRPHSAINEFAAAIWKHIQETANHPISFKRMQPTKVAIRYGVYRMDGCCFFFLPSSLLAIAIGITGNFGGKQKLQCPARSQSIFQYSNCFSIRRICFNRLRQHRVV